MSEPEYETFEGLGGQRRYKCRMRWESGARCEFDTYSLPLIKEHERGHDRSAQPGGPKAMPMPLLFDPKGNRIVKEERGDPSVPSEFRDYRFRK